MKTKTKRIGRFMTFGKYKGEPIAEVCQEDPLYIDWALQNVDGFEINESERAIQSKHYASARQAQEYHSDDLNCDHW